MNLFLLVLFIVVGIFGLIYRVDTGIFVGLSLTPWQILQINPDRRIKLTAIIVTAIIGSIYFISVSKWLLFVLFLVVELYNYWGYLNVDRG